MALRSTIATGIIHLVWMVESFSQNLCKTVMGSNFPYRRPRSGTAEYIRTGRGIYCCYSFYSEYPEDRNQRLTLSNNMRLVFFICAPKQKLLPLEAKVPLRYSGWNSMNPKMRGKVTEAPKAMGVKPHYCRFDLRSYSFLFFSCFSSPSMIYKFQKNMNIQKNFKIGISHELYKLVQIPPRKYFSWRNLRDNLRKTWNYKNIFAVRVTLGVKHFLLGASKIFASGSY